MVGFDKSFLALAAVVCNAALAQPIAPYTEQSSSVNTEVFSRRGETDMDAKLMYEFSSLVTTVTGCRTLEKCSEWSVANITERLPAVQKFYNMNDLQHVWGPAFNMEQHTTHSDGPTFLNEMVVFYSREQKTAYIGIAGTNFKSVQDWLLEDFHVKPVAWPYANQQVNAGNVLQGALTGLMNLQQIRPFNKVPGEALNIAQALETLYHQFGLARVRVTGHSLGGALSPVFALWLQDVIFANRPDVSITSNIYAGPTPGDSAFAAYYKTRPLAEGTVRKDNYRDAVPHAWKVSTLNEMSSLYIDRYGDVSRTCLQPIVDYGLHLAKDSDAEFINPNQNSPIDCGWMRPKDYVKYFSLNSGLLNGVENIVHAGVQLVSDHCVDELKTNVGPEMAWQHTTAYDIYFCPISNPDVPRDMCL